MHQGFPSNSYSTDFPTRQRLPSKLHEYNIYKFIHERAIGAVAQGREPRGAVKLIAMRAGDAAVLIAVLYILGYPPVRAPNERRRALTLVGNHDEQRYGTGVAVVTLVIHGAVACHRRCHNVSDARL